MKLKNRCAIRKMPHECLEDNNMTCSLCLLGQIVDSIELQITAIANLTASMEDRKSEKLDIEHNLDINPIFEGE